MTIPVLPILSNPTFLQILMNLAGEIVQNAAQHAAIDNHPQTAFNLGLLGQIFAPLAGAIQQTPPTVPPVNPIAPLIQVPASAKAETVITTTESAIQQRIKNAVTEALISKTTT